MSRNTVQVSGLTLQELQDRYVNTRVDYLTSPNQSTLRAYDLAGRALRQAEVTQ